MQARSHIMSESSADADADTLQVWNNKERKELGSGVYEGFVLLYKINPALCDGPPSIKKLQLRTSSAETHRFIECDEISAPQRIQRPATEGDLAGGW